MVTWVCGGMVYDYPKGLVYFQRVSSPVVARGEEKGAQVLYLVLGNVFSKSMLHSQDLLFVSSLVGETRVVSVCGFFCLVLQVFAADFVV